MGVTVRERDGSWWVYIHHRGKRKAKKVGDKKAAQAVAAKLQAKFALGDLSALEDTRKPLTFAEYSTTWLKVYAEVHCKPATVQEYRKEIRLHLSPAFGSLTLPEITRERIKLHLAEKLAAGGARWKGKALSQGAARNILLVLRAVLNHAVDDGLLASNPAARLGKFAKRKDETADDRLDVFTREELAHLLAVARRELPAAYPPILILAASSLRESELFGLQRDDLEFARQFLWVRRAATAHGVTTPKSGKVRRVDLSAQVCQILKAYLTQRDAEAVLRGQEPPVWVFPGPDGGPMGAGFLFRHLWHPALDRAGLCRRGPHQWRHTYTALLIAAGAHPKYIQAQLGHHSIQVTMDLYGHLFEGDHRRYVEVLDTVLNATSRNAGATAPPGVTTPAAIPSP